MITYRPKLPCSTFSYLHMTSYQLVLHNDRCRQETGKTTGCLGAQDIMRAIKIWDFRQGRKPKIRVIIVKGFSGVSSKVIDSIMGCRGG